MEPVRKRWRGVRRRWRVLLWLVAWLTVLIGLAMVGSHDENLGGGLLFGFFAGTLVILIALGVRAVSNRATRARPTRDLGLSALSHEPFRPGQRVWRRPSGVRWLWSGGTVIFDCSVSAGDLADRLRRSVRPERVLDKVVPSGQLIGWVGDARLQVTANIPLLYNAFNSVLNAEILPEQSGARVAGVLRMRRAVMGFMLLWLGFATILGILVFVTTLVTPTRWHPSPPPVFVGPLFPVFGLLVLAVTRLFALPQEALLVARLGAAISDGPE